MTSNLIGKPGLSYRRKGAGKCAGSVTLAQAKASYDYDLLIIGCGVGGHGAALHAVESVSGNLADPLQLLL